MAVAGVVSSVAFLLVAAALVLLGVFDSPQAFLADFLEASGLGASRLSILLFPGGLGFNLATPLEYSER